MEGCVHVYMYVQVETNTWMGMWTDGVGRRVDGWNHI